MSWFQFILVYLLSWWMVLFMVLPLWVRTPEQPMPGHAIGAPEHPRLGRKLLLTTLLAFIPALLLMAAASAHAADGVYHAGQAKGKCHGKVAYTPPADINATDKDATLNPNPLAAETDDVRIPLAIPAAPYLNRGAPISGNTTNTTPYNADLSQSFMQMGDIHVKKDGESTLNDKPIGAQPDDCYHIETTKKK